MSAIAAAADNNWAIYDSIELKEGSRYKFFTSQFDESLQWIWIMAFRILNYVEDPLRLDKRVLERKLLCYEINAIKVIYSNYSLPSSFASSFSCVFLASSLDQFSVAMPISLQTSSLGGL